MTRNTYNVQRACAFSQYLRMIKIEGLIKQLFDSASVLVCRELGIHTLYPSFRPNWSRLDFLYLILFNCSAGWRYCGPSEKRASLDGGQTSDC